GYQLLAPREDPGAGLGHHYQSPYRLRCIALMATPFGREVYRLRGAIERRYGCSTSFGGGLGPLPAWVRDEDRVWLWTSAKLALSHGVSPRADSFSRNSSGVSLRNSQKLSSGTFNPSRPYGV